LILLLLALIEYIVAQIVKLVNLILKNLKALKKAIEYADEHAIMAIMKKLAAVLCIFQNFFVLLSIFSIVYQTIKEMLSMMFAIPPCDDGDCCTPEVCPTIVKAPFTRTTGNLQYLNAVKIGVPGLDNVSIDIRKESWQIYDFDQEIAQKFINIVDGYDVYVSPKPVFFPTDVNYTEDTNPKQAAYTVDMRFLYYSDEPVYVPNGVLYLAGGSVFEDDDTIMKGYASDGVTPIDGYATLNNFFHKKDDDSLTAPNNPIKIKDIEYTFNPVISTLLGKNIITSGCIPELALNKAFLSNMIGTDLAVKLDALRGLSFPDTDGAQQCLTLAVNNLRNNLTEAGVADFQAFTTACLDNLRNQCCDALKKLVEIGFDACQSQLSLSQKVQFTSRPIIVSVDLKDKSGISLMEGLPSCVTDSFTIKGYPTFGKIGDFTFDGYQYYTAPLTSDIEGSGQIMVSFDNKILCTNILPADPTIPPSNVLQILDYKFIYAPIGSSARIAEGEASDGDSSRRDEGDVSRELSDGGN